MKHTKMLMVVLFILTNMGTLGCPELASVLPNPPVVTDQDQCSAACHRLRELGCPEGAPIDMKHACVSVKDCSPQHTCVDGKCFASCEQFCVDTQNQGVWLDPACVSKVFSCSQVDYCPLKKK